MTKRFTYDIENIYLIETTPRLKKLKKWSFNNEDDLNELCYLLNKNIDFNQEINIEITDIEW